MSKNIAKSPASGCWGTFGEFMAAIGPLPRMTRAFCSSARFASRRVGGGVLTLGGGCGAGSCK